MAQSDYERNDDLTVYLESAVRHVLLVLLSGYVFKGQMISLIMCELLSGRDQ